VEGEAFEVWYRGHYRRVYASVLLIAGDRAATAEAVDEAFTRAWERWPRVQGMASPVGWTFTVARNHLRRAARRRARERALVPSPPPAGDVDVELWDVVRALPRRERELVVLRYVAGLTEAEVAATLGLASGTVARGLHDARARLHTMLDPEEDKA
jgi:RNA polymerase sigma-70 factor (ECF subfamily)